MQTQVFGIDFDNTIVSYDVLFHKVAVEKHLIPTSLAQTKNAVKRYLCESGKEEVWTLLQGEVYGFRMLEALPYPGVKAFFRTCSELGIPVRIISHKTRRPYLGEPYDLHAAATAWLQAHDFFSDDGASLDPTSVFFELTKEAKLQRIRSCECTHFIDDLPEILCHPEFPQRVHRLLFSPDQNETDHKPENKACETQTSTSWRQISAKLLGDASWKVEARELASNPYAPLSPLSGGANNQVYVVGKDKVAKRYFYDQTDGRDRFKVERAFYHYCDASSLDGYPRPLGWCADQRIGLFAFVKGTQPQAVQQRHVDGALSFAINLNTSRCTPEGKALPLASEACFSLSAHIQTVASRIEQMRTWPADSPLENSFHSFVSTGLVPRLQQTVKQISESYNTSEIGAELREEERCISPSDFGFHNCIEAHDGTFSFFDFEYAGWDDPAKLVCDFFCQPRVPVHASFFTPFATRLATGLRLVSTEAFIKRCKALLPLYRLKWCAIVLNEFAPVGSRRRCFSLGEAQNPDRMRMQLGRAQNMLESLPLTTNGLNGLP